jgi:hypothetical protein
MSVETWKTIFEIGGVILLFLTFIFGAGVVFTSGRINKVQSQQLRQFDKDLTDAKTELGAQQERAAIAERELKDVDIKTEGFRLAIAQANERAAKAQESLALAEQHSAEANAKAEGFRLDIATANKHAAEASRIAEEERLKRVQIEERMKPRSLKISPEAMSALKAFKGTEYTFSSVFADEESVTLLKQLDSILLSAGWMRVKPPHAYPAINVYGKEQDFAVASGLSSGIKISVDSETSLGTLQATPVGQLPAPVGAAVALAMELTAGLAPPQDNGISANVQPGQSVTVRIEIGRKP